MSSYAVTNGRAVLPTAIVDNATIVVEHGVIASIVEAGAAPPHAIDARGSFCLPGIVDTHSDGLEKELRPRPGVELPVDFALRSFEGRIRAAGVTTLFHGVGFENGEKYDRSVTLANSLCDAIERRAPAASSLVDHRILYRLDARDADGFDALRLRLRRRDADRVAPLVSFEDHTPGQGQYTDRVALERYIAGTRGLSDEVARKVVDEMTLERERLAANRDSALPWLTTEAGAGRIQLMAHDPVTVEDIEDAGTWNAAIAEFPTTVEAAQHAKERGLRTVCGGPNVLRGESHSGNVSAAELIAFGLCDGLASDYLPSTLIGAVGVLVDRGVCDLVRAVALVTSGPADTVGLADRGRLVPGQRGDLAIVAREAGWLTVRRVMRPEDHPAEDLLTEVRCPSDLEDEVEHATDHDH